MDSKETKVNKVTEALNRVYDEEPSQLDNAIAQMQWRSLPKEDWRPE